MNARWCHRCQSELPAHEDGTLVYCAQCGAPQVRLSEDLLEAQALRNREAAPEAESLPAPAAPWRLALQLAALASGLAATLAVLTALVPATLPLGWLWAVVSPIVVLGVLASRMPGLRFSAGFGARVGMITGLAVGAAMGAMYILAGVIARRAHLLGGFDAEAERLMRNAQAQAAAQSSAADAAQAVQWLATPENRVAWFLLSMGFVYLLFVALTTVGGAFAGYARSRRA